MHYPKILIQLDRVIDKWPPSAHMRLSGACLDREIKFVAQVGHLSFNKPLMSALPKSLQPYVAAISLASISPSHQLNRQRVCLTRARSAPPSSGPSHVDLELFGGTFWHSANLHNISGHAVDVSLKPRRPVKRRVATRKWSSQASDLGWFAL
ncbi:hypothetical protein RM531_08005 [Salinisphaera sp. P385]|uniref:Uncharacterized protein n=1 Tax=Spectribacter acetivorans TaxID=3075603 RepID=A0ABU3B7H6_9GAMM|nr:hypothetical protein [Salinisphaera sp. P385]MDT0618417.1 hypothetical protein [Salinisphaera sp. P385]